MVAVCRSFCAIGLFLLVIYLVYRWISKKTAGRKSVLLLGLSGSGKTRLFCELCRETPSDTCTSMICNIGTYTKRDGSGKVKVVDIPGNNRVINHRFGEHKYSSKAIIFMVDNSTAYQHIAEIAVMVSFAILDVAVFYKSVPVFLILHGRGEKESAQLAEYKNTLENEINMVRSVVRTRPTSVINRILELCFVPLNLDKTFRFDDLRNRIEFLEFVDHSECVEKVKEILEKI